VALVSTRVGQAQEIVEDGTSGWLVEVGDADGLAARAAAVRDETLPAVRDAARATAERYALPRLDPAWTRLLDGFVEGGTA
jgi:glycosyltransferase involved in cell wall biosynthesis